MNIKLLLLSIIMMFAFSGLRANLVTKENASKVAVNFYYQAINSQLPTDFNSIKISESFTESENGIIYYYVFNIENGGFVIVSAEDARLPILGYSFEKNFSNINPSPEFTWWMSGYKEQIRLAKENNLTADPKTIEVWNEYSSFKPFSKSPLDATVGPFVLSRWDQNFPYNELCPDRSHCDPPNQGGSGGHVYAGCVATAMGQLMNYYKYPLQGANAHCYSSAWGTLCSTYSDSTYNWNEMPNQLTGSNMPVASLLYQLAIAVNMGWGCDGSGAFSYSVPNALRMYFGYANTTYLYERINYTQQQWETMIKNQHDQKNPLYYSGQSSSGGHAFICDGYKVVGTTTTYHFNWGWSGSNDGWFDINNVGGYTGSQAIVSGSVPGTGYPYNCTGQKTLSALEGVFEDGSGHLDYQPNMNCSWLIDPINPSGTDHISFKFDLFEISDPNDIITIYDGENSSAPVLATYKGGQAPEIGTIYNSTSPKLYVTFTSDGTTNSSGWYISYSTVSIVHCTGTVTLPNSNFTFEDGSGSTYNYNNGAMCKWKIGPTNATYVKLKFTEFQTEQDMDKVMIYKDFSASAANLLGTYSGSTIPDTITSPTGKMYIIFSTDGSRTYSGWTAQVISDGTSGINENEVINDISVFPNPAENNVKITFNVYTLQNIELSVVDVIGNTVYNESTNNFVGSFEKSIDLSTFAKGLYVVRIKTDNGSYNQKLVIR